MTLAYDCMIAAARLEIATDIAALTDAQLADALQDMLCEAGACLIMPDTRGAWGPLEVEITMLAISASGPTAIDAARKWARLVIDMDKREREEIDRRVA